MKSRVLEYSPYGKNDFKEFASNIDSIPKNVFTEFINEIGNMYNNVFNKSIDTKGKKLDFIEELNLLTLNKECFYPELINHKLYVCKDTNAYSDEKKKIYHSIQEAIDAAADDDSIIICNDGYYYEDLIINKRIRISSNSEPVKIIPKTDAGIRIEGDCYLSNLIFTNTIPSYITDNAEIIETKKEKKSPLIIIKDSKPKLDNCIIYKANGIGISINNAAPEITDCTIARSNDANIYINGKSVADIIDCIICYAKDSNGIEIAGDSKVRIERADIFRNACSGIKSTENSSGKIIDSTIHQNSEYGFEDYSEGYLSNYSGNYYYWNGKDGYRDFFNNPL